MAFYAEIVETTVLIMASAILSFTILDPALKLTELTQVQTKVAELLEQGLNPKPKPDSEAEISENAAEPIDSKLPSKEKEA